jgi:hypothetical protein
MTYCMYCCMPFSGSGKYVSSGRVILCGSDRCMQEYTQMLKCKNCDARRHRVNKFHNKYRMCACSNECLNELLVQQVEKQATITPCQNCKVTVPFPDVFIAQVKLVRYDINSYVTRHYPFCSVRCWRQLQECQDNK